MKRILPILLLIICYSCVMSSYSYAVLPPVKLSLATKIDVAPFLTEPQIHISAGNLTTPYILDQAHTEYILEGDITADSTAFEIVTSYVALNLNGHKITYNNVSPGAGVWIHSFHRHDIAIHSGEIHQGAAMSEGNVYGDGSNPIRNRNGMYPENHADR